MAAALLLLAAVPFAVFWRFGPLGQSVNNDLAFHMTWADWLGPRPLVRLRRATRWGRTRWWRLWRACHMWSVDQGFAGVLMAVPALTGICALDFVRDLPARLRVLTALLAGLSVPGRLLLRAGLVQGAAGGTVLPRRGGRPAGAAAGAWPRWHWGCWELARWRASAPPAWPGSRWPRWRRFWSAAGADRTPRLDRGGRPVRGGTAGHCSDRLLRHGPGRFLFDSASGPGGNFRDELNPLEVLGVWPSPDFQAARSSAAFVAALAVGVLAGIAGGWVWRRRGDRLPAVALLLALALAAVATAATIPYISAKALVVAAPLLMVVVTGGLFLARPGRARSQACLGVGVRDVRGPGRPLVAAGLARSRRHAGRRGQGAQRPRRPGARAADAVPW